MICWMEMGHQSLSSQSPPTCDTGDEGGAITSSNNIQLTNSFFRITRSYWLIHVAFLWLTNGVSGWHSWHWIYSVCPGLSAVLRSLPVLHITLQVNTENEKEQQKNIPCIYPWKRTKANEKTEKTSPSSQWIWRAITGLELLSGTHDSLSFTAC